MKKLGSTGTKPGNSQAFARLEAELDFYGAQDEIARASTATEVAKAESARNAADVRLAAIERVLA